MGVSHFVGSDDEISRLLGVVKAVEQALVEDMAVLDGKALQEALALDPKDLFSKPAQPGEPMSTIGDQPRRSRRRRR